MPRCPSCANETPAEARFCPSCGAALAAQAPPVSERRVVSILFVDLVGFTTRSDRADPEDVRHTLIPFHAAVQRVLETFGGTLDKFIGDAVMGVFGAPVAHEDDPIRAVRAGLAILDAMAEIRRDDPGLSVRVAVNTGEAIVTTGAGPQVGEAVAGDVVNTASRMESLAPTDSLVIGATTRRAIGEGFEVEQLPPATVKGKADPLAIWRVLGERQSPAVDAGPAVFVGRRRELAVLRACFDRVVSRPSLELATIVGEPGIGKSRLVAQFRGELEGSCRWLAGHCVPYGEAVTLAPMVEVIRGLAGISPADPPAIVEERLASLAEEVEGAPDERSWLVARLGSVLGSGSGDPADGAVIPARELAQAWSRVLRHVAREQPLVIELDDLQWAEPVLMDMVAFLVEELEGLGVLVLGTARPEFLDRSDGWNRAGVAVVELTRLTGDETGALLAALLDDDPSSASEVAAVVKRAGGNPLYAVEFARMLRDRVLDDFALAMTMPDSVQAVIAARLDAMPIELRALVQDAAVLGSACWPGALASIGTSDSEEVLGGLDRLTRRGVMRVAAGSDFDGEPEFAFTHALLAEVAYGRIPRRERAVRHLAAARWIQEMTHERAGERAEVLAHHAATAAELAEAAGDRFVADEARGSALRWLMEAADRVGRLDPGGALDLCERAIRLAPDGTSERAAALAASAVAGRRSGRLAPREVADRYEAALGIYRVRDDPKGIGRSLTNLGSQLGAIGETERSRALLAEAVEVLTPSGATRDLARAYAYRAEEEMFAGRTDGSLAFANRALALLEEPELETTDELVAMCLHIRGDARCSMGDVGGIDDLRRALEIAEARGSAADIVASCDYLAEWIRAMEGPPAAREFSERGIALAELRGIASQGMWSKAGSLTLFFELGDWDRVIAQADELLALGSGHLDAAVHVAARISRSLVSVLRGRRDEADEPEDLVSLARPIDELHVLTPALVTAAVIALADGSTEDAARFLHQFEERTRQVAAEYRESRLAQVVRACLATGEHELASRLVEEAAGLTRRDHLQLQAAHAALTEAAGDRPAAAALYREACTAWQRFGVPWEEALALQGVGRCAVDRAEARDATVRSDEILQRLGVPGSHGVGV